MHSPSWFDVPHLHLQASFIMILCPLTHVHRISQKVLLLPLTPTPRSSVSIHVPGIICLWMAISVCFIKWKSQARSA